MGIGNSIIGALRVNLGLDSASFTNGLKLAQGDLDKFGKFAKLGFIGVASAAAGVATALAIATRGAINHADAMSKLAQKAGVTTEALSRLSYAASYSDVSAEDLASNLGKLSKVMADASQSATSSAATAFAALGISVTDSSGKLRDADKVFAEIADRFAGLEDGSTKTAIAMTLFGKSGAELIPFLNGGASDMQRLADEADRLGITLSTKTGRAAERFNDTLAVIGNVFQGISNRIAEAALPALQQFADAITNPDFQAAAIQLSKWIVDAMTAIVDAVSGASRAIRDLWNAITRPAGAGAAGAGVDAIKQQIADWKAYGDAATDAISKGRAANEIAALQAELAARQAGKTTLGGSAFSGGWGAGGLDGGAAGGDGSGSGGGVNASLFAQGLAKAKQELDPFAARFEELTPVLEKLHDPFQQMKDDLTDLATMFKNGRITAEQYGDAVTRTNLNAVGSFASMAAGVAGALGDLFKDNKAFAVSNAILQGLSGVAYALGSSAPPWNFINAAAVGIESAANVASILATNQNSTSMPASSSGAAAATAAPAASAGLSITFKGSGTFNIDDVFRQATQQIADGGLSDFVRVVRVTS